MQLGPRPGRYCDGHPQTRRPDAVQSASRYGHSRRRLPDCDGPPGESADARNAAGRTQPAAHWLVLVALRTRNGAPTKGSGQDTRRRTILVMGKLRRLFESLVYAGMKPQRPGGEPAKPKSAWRQRLEQMINGSANTDPLYLSNRTIWQRFRAAAVVVGPIILLVAVLALAWSDVFKTKDAPKTRELTAAEKAARICPTSTRRFSYRPITTWTCRMFTWSTVRQRGWWDSQEQHRPRHCVRRDGFRSHRRTLVPSGRGEN